MSMKMRVLEEHTQNEIKEMYKNMNMCRNIRYIYRDSDTKNVWLIQYLSLDGHTPTNSECKKCDQDDNYILSKYKEYDNLINKNIRYPERKRRCTNAILTLLMIKKFRMSMFTSVPKDVINIITTMLWHSQKEDLW